MAYYLIRIGEGSKYIEEAKQKGFVAIGWNEVPDLSQYRNVDDEFRLPCEALKSANHGVNHPVRASLPH